MMLKSVLLARANRGYRWLENYGLRYDLDVSRLHQATTVLAVSSAYTCPLAVCDINDNGYSRVVARLRLSQGIAGRHGSKLDDFLTSHGFDIWPSYPAFLLFRAGSPRDWSNLTDAWLKVIAANQPLASATDD